jgi:P-type E1-E2 ATPase
MDVTITLAYSVMKMKEERNLVRHLDAAKAMCIVNNVYTDKTGTLAEGDMSIKNVLFDETSIMSEELNIRDKSKEVLMEAVANNISAYVEMVDERLVAKGNPTECALMQLLINKQLK